MPCSCKYDTGGRVGPMCPRCQQVSAQIREEIALRPKIAAQRDVVITCHSSRIQLETARSKQGGTFTDINDMDKHAAICKRIVVEEGTLRAMEDTMSKLQESPT